MEKLGTRENTVWRRWQSWWPLPIGRKSLEQACIEAYPSPAEDFIETRDYITALNMMPFEGWEEVLWATRIVRDGGAVLDLFGLARYRTEQEGRDRDTPITAGDIIYALRGEDASLTDLAHAAKRWWGQFQGLTSRGRPPGSGEWRGREHFAGELRRAAREIRSDGKKVTQESVAAYLNTSSRLIRHWLDRYNILWTEIRRG